MKKGICVFLIFTVLMPVIVVPVHALLDITIGGGDKDKDKEESEEDKKEEKKNWREAVAEGLADGIKKNIKNWFATAIKYLSDFFMSVLFTVYSFIGTILLPIPDLAAPDTYQFMAKRVGSSDGARAAEVIQNVFRITTYCGLFVLIVGFMMHVGKSVMSLSGSGLGAGILFRLIIPAVLIFSWPTLFSFCARLGTDLAFLIYNQNTLSTSGVFAGLRDFKPTDLTSGGTDSGSNASPRTSARAGNVEASMIQALRFARFLGIFGCLMAAFIGSTRMAEGNPVGAKMLIGAVIGFILVMASPFLLRWVITEGGADQVGTSPMPGESIELFDQEGVLDRGIDFPGEKLQQSASQDTGKVVVSKETDEKDEGYIAMIVGDILKIFVAVWGVIICIGVMFAKFFQILSLLMLFLLGPLSDPSKPLPRCPIRGWHFPSWLRPTLRLIALGVQSFCFQTELPR